MLNLASMNVSKPSKAVALKLVKSLHTGSLDTYDTEVALGQLYQFFIPATPAKPKTDTQWVCKALAKKDVRYFLNYLFVEDGHMVATDGHRLHTTRTDLPNGSYDKALGLIDPDVAGRFPDWKRVIPAHQTNAQLADMDKELIEIEGRFRYELKLDGKTLVTVDKKYFDDAMSMMDNPRVTYGQHFDSILLQEGDSRAVVMPVRVAS